MRAIENERDRLEKLYESFSNDDLLALDPTELTDVGGEALATEMRRRRLSRDSVGGHSTEVAPAILDLERRIAEEASSPTIPDEDDGLISFCTFWDGLELSKAYTALQEQEVPFKLKVYNADLELRRPAYFDVRVSPDDKLRAEAVLRDAMGYFPLQEVEGEVGFVDDGIPVALGDFETQEEADKVTGLLTGAGIASKQTKNDEPDEDGIYWHMIEVSGGDLDRGLDVVAKGLGLR